MNPFKLTGLTILLLLTSDSFGQGSMIPKHQLQDMFDSISESTDWDMSGDMLWGYFFTNSDRSALEQVAPILDEMGYSVKSIYLSDKDSEDESDLWWLHVEKVETHSVDSLYATNLVLHEFAEQHGIDSYDGMDVGPVESPD